MILMKARDYMQCKPSSNVLFCSPAQVPGLVPGLHGRPSSAPFSTLTAHVHRGRDGIKEVLCQNGKLHINGVCIKLHFRNYRGTPLFCTLDCAVPIICTFKLTHEMRTPLYRIPYFVLKVPRIESLLTRPLHGVLYVHVRMYILTRQVFC